MLLLCKCGAATVEDMLKWNQTLIIHSCHAHTKTNITYYIPEISLYIIIFIASNIIPMYHLSSSYWHGIYLPGYNIGVSVSL